MPRFPWILKEVGLEIRIGSSKSSRKSEKKENVRIFAHRNPNFLFFIFPLFLCSSPTGVTLEHEGEDERASCTKKKRRKKGRDFQMKGDKRVDLRKCQKICDNDENTPLVLSCDGKRTRYFDARLRFFLIPPRNSKICVDLGF